MPALLALLASVPFLYILWRRPLLRRLAVRNALRRPWEAALVVAGSMLGTAIITGTLVVGDTMDTSIRRLAYTRLGPVDEVVVTQSRERLAEALRAVESVRQSVGSADVDGVLAFGRLPVTAVSGVGGSRRAAPRSQLIELDFAAATRFGRDPDTVGVEGPSPAPGHAVITEDLAAQLDLEAGEALQVFAYGVRLRLAVDRVVPARGLTGFSTGFFSERSRNALVGPGTIAALEEAAGVGGGAGRAAPPDWIVAVSNRGGVEDGAVHTAAVQRRLEAALRPLGLRASPLKQDLLREAEDDAASFREIFGAMGTFGILAGVLLLVNIFVMLGEERKPELGIARAVGMRRSSLVAAFSAEGWLYSVAASAVGTLVGLGLGRAIIGFIEGIFEQRVAEGFGLDLHFAATGASLQAGFALGLVIALVAVVLTSVRVARFNVIRAIRDLPDPRLARTRLRWLVAGAGALVAGAALSAASFGGGSPPGRLVGPVLVLVGAAPLLGRWVPRGAAATAAATLVLLWGAVGFPVTSDLDEAGVETFVLQGVILTAAGVVLVTREHDLLERAARRLGGSAGALAVRLGLAYPIARRFRTGLTLAMYSLVIFTLTFIGVFSDVFRSQVDETARDISGGYDVFIRSSPGNPVPLAQLEEVPGVEAVAPIATVRPVDFRPAGWPEPVDWSLSGFDERWLAHGPPELADRGRYPSDRAAYEAVLRDPGLILVDEFFLQGEPGPSEREVEVGDRIDMVDPRTGAVRRVRVAAIAADDFLFNGALYGLDHLRSFVGPRAVVTRAYVAVEGRPAADVAAAIAGRFVEQGVEADPIRDLLSEFIAVQDQFFQLFRGYLGFGLLVGVAGLGVVMVRAVRERRREIGVLRALGFQAGTVRRSFLFESAFVALEGTLIGVSLALVTAWNVIVNSGAFGENVGFTVSPLSLVVVVVGTLAFSLLATAAPTRAAARVRPALALRIAD